MLAKSFRVVELSAIDWPSSYLLTIMSEFSAAILPVVKKQHQLLVTLLLCNAVAMEVFDLILIYYKSRVASAKC